MEQLRCKKTGRLCGDIIDQHGQPCKCENCKKFRKMEVLYTPYIEDDFNIIFDS